MLLPITTNLFFFYISFSHLYFPLFQRVSLQPLYSTIIIIMYLYISEGVHTHVIIVCDSSFTIITCGTNSNSNHYYVIYKTIHRCWNSLHCGCFSLLLQDTWHRSPPKTSLPGLILLTKINNWSYISLCITQRNWALNT